MDQQIGIFSEKKFLLLQRLVREGIRKDATHTCVVLIIGRDDSVHVVDCRYKPLRVLDNVGFSGFLVTMDVFPGTCIVEAEFVGRNADYRAIFLMKDTDHVRICPIPDMSNHGYLSDGMELWTRVVP